MDVFLPSVADGDIVSSMTEGIHVCDMGCGEGMAINLMARAFPMAPFLYTVSLMHCMPVGLVSGGTGLGMMWGREKAVEMLEATGFQSIEVNEIPQDSFNLHYYSKKSAGQGFQRQAAKTRSKKS